MKPIIEYFIDNPAVTLVLTLILFIGGLAGGISLGQLEDPAFTVKTGVVTTHYPGASPEQVELEVTDVLEQALFEMPELESTVSYSKAGVSIIKIDIKQEYWSDRLPQVWDHVRKKIGDAAAQLPPGATRPTVTDDFSFVFGFVLAVTGQGFNYAELEDYADALKKEFNLLANVSRVELWGVQQQVVYVDASQTQLSERGLTSADVIFTLGQQNAVVDAGSLDLQDRRLRVAPTGEFGRPEDIADLIINPSAMSVLQPGDDPGRTLAGLSATTTVTPGVRRLSRAGEELIRIGDIATVTSGYAEPPYSLMRFNGQPAIGIQIAAREGANIQTLGAQIADKIDTVKTGIPVGLEINRVAWQADLVRDSINGMVINIILAVIIVLIVLIIPSGVRMGGIIAVNLLLTIVATFMFMSMLGMDLERVSLGALIIAMGMMVDNAIVISDGISVRLQQGLDRRTAAIETAARNAYPLLAATIIALMAFYPVYASPNDSGEYAQSLFTVIAIALFFSWFQAMYFTPLQCMKMLADPEKGAEGGAEKDAFSGGFFDTVRKVLRLAIRARMLTTATLVGLLIFSFYAFQSIPQLFFPDSTRPQLMIDYWAPEGTRIQQVSGDLQPIEDRILAHPEVVNVSTYMGVGAPRFYLPVDPELPYASYAQFIINFTDYDEIESFIEEIEPWLEANFPQALTRVRKYGVGPSDTWKFEARFSGPAEADLGELRRIAEDAMEILHASPLAKEIRTDMRQRTQKVVPEFDDARARWANVTRPDIADATKRAYDGAVVGLYRQGDDLMPIVLRHPEDERQMAARDLGTLQVEPRVAGESVPLEQVTSSIATEWEDPIIVRFNRHRSVAVQASPDGVTFPTLRAAVIDDIHDIDLPGGYTLFWDGEYDSSKTAQDALIPGSIVAFVLLVFLIVTVFNAFRPLLIILCTIPFAFIGITLGFFVFYGADFGFLAILGALSLVGMMNKNIVVLLDAAVANVESGMSRYEAIIEAAVTRVRPVLLAASTTALGVAPLLPDIFWRSMAITIMFGLAVGSILTLLFVPVLYSIFYRVKEPAPDQAPTS